MPTAGPDVALGLLADLRGRSLEDLQAASERALAAVNLEGFGDRPVHALSGGQRQRVAIAGALAQRSRTLLLDELTTFLDGAERDRVLQIVKMVVRGGKGGGGDGRGGDGSEGGPEGGGRGRDVVTALWVTHRLEELSAADSASLLEDGRVTVSGDPAAVREALMLASRREDD